DKASATLAWRNGTWVANGNLVWRHFGIPTVTVPMGTMADIGMPVGLTFAGKAYDDERLLRMAGDYERSTQRRTRPPRTPELPDDVFSSRPGQVGDGNATRFAITLSAETWSSSDRNEIVITLDLPGEAAETASVRVHVNGEAIALQQSGARFSGRALVPAAEHQRLHSVWRGSYGS
ncbi:MAG: amidase, partial [Mesorhizobium sp.]